MCPGPGPEPGPGVICGLSLLLVLFSALRGFLRVLQFSHLLKNQKILECTGISERVLANFLGVPWVNKSTDIFIYLHTQPRYLELSAVFWSFNYFPLDTLFSHNFTVGYVELLLS